VHIGKGGRDGWKRVVLEVFSESSEEEVNVLGLSVSKLQSPKAYLFGNADHFLVVE
jgi:hypothetical protein